MKCDLKRVQKNEDGSDSYVPCSRPRSTIVPTRFGRMGLCEECREFMRDAESEYQDLNKKAAGKPLGKSVKLDSGAKGREAPKLMVWYRHGHVVCEQFPPAR